MQREVVRPCHSYAAPWVVAKGLLRESTQYYRQTEHISLVTVVVLFPFGDIPHLDVLEVIIQ